ncbi:MAG: lytic murein transglycosylase B [Gammaproteobacteria bacterium RIFCSPLOWO2_01_FULL_47_190]|uniref:Lytic murein transglycosylase B n=2 Tax=environmental samples TaxID=50423 RepID=A0A0H4TXN1_9GAMM|nr:lytic murein transglycosylase B [uncultured gamma proteobacterium Rifle_16ft_4_minimus_39789]AKQ05799.1 lytic murein transglycosylase B [uncultured gamma proteobacterium Rifle_16ft_4_minimus_38164]OGT65816.1 MAG: lytic murein transglycosylase B [Gammaproteobacteria bacterium RIFCSPLOWO2_01_FULL_47_190]OGT76736.1 MAG: lytic murein transglycosylase B [Gammaproteobacteria bacterium RIFCSPLOWO2_12_47_11]OGT84040.1 MAG: lytic murein transglycosylase B [Gammaproteobacteria bacterium RIFCSPLOWO2_12
MQKIIKLTVLAVMINSGNAGAQLLDQKEISNFIDHMVSTHQYNRAELEAVFKRTNKSERVLAAISKPAEALPWYKYRPIFIQQNRIEQGLAFWVRHQDLLARAEKEYGVPAQIIVAIIGVETMYGTNTGKDRVMDALATLAFHYPIRAAFFRSELEHFLLLAREQNIDPLSLNGSYAGAMGMPQFISSSYRHYAVDFDRDGKIDIWNNPADAIGSVANYFCQHGWTLGQKVVVPGSVTGDKYTQTLTDDLKPGINAGMLYSYGIEINEKIPPGVNVKVLSLEGPDGEEIWICLNNFYVITRYNRSPLYAMAVYQLSEEILGKYGNNVAHLK